MIQQINQLSSVYMTQMVVIKIKGKGNKGARCKVYVYDVG